MSVLVKGMEKPEHCGYCRFRYDGICHAIQKTQYSMDECPLVGIDDVLDTNVGDTISRQAAIDAVGNCEPGEELFMIESLPSIDAVPVIRCKDCKHRYIKNDVWTCPFGLMSGPDGYCSYGEIKEERNENK